MPPVQHLPSLLLLTAHHHLLRQCSKLASLLQGTNVRGPLMFSSPTTEAIQAQKLWNGRKTSRRAWCCRCITTTASSTRMAAAAVWLPAHTCTHLDHCKQGQQAAPLVRLLPLPLRRCQHGTLDFPVLNIRLPSGQCGTQAPAQCGTQHLLGLVPQCHELLCCLSPSGEGTRQQQVAQAAHSQLQEGAVQDDTTTRQ